MYSYRLDVFMRYVERAVLRRQLWHRRVALELALGILVFTVNHPTVADLQPILYLQDAASVMRDVRLVCHEDHGDAAFAIELLKTRHDLHTRSRIERSGWFVRQNDARLVDQRPRDRHPLLLPTAQFSRWRVPAIRVGNPLPILSAPIKPDASVVPLEPQFI